MKCLDTFTSKFRSKPGSALRFFQSILLVDSESFSESIFFDGSGTKKVGQS